MTLEALAARLSDAAIVLDLDGTIAPIVPDPPAARPLPDLIDPLRILAGRALVVAIVTGRPSAFVRSVLDVRGSRSSAPTGSRIVLPSIRRWSPH